MFRTTMAACVAALGVMTAAPAGAVTLFDNLIGEGGFGGWNPNMIPDWDGFVAQRFELTQAATLTSAEFFVYIDDAELPPLVQDRPVNINWKIMRDDGVGGLPSTVLAFEDSDSGAVAASFISCQNQPCLISNWSFALPSVELGAGTYYLALQNYGDEHTYISSGALFDDRTYSIDGGATWAVQAKSGNSHGWAVKINGDLGVSAAPEPGAWALMILGFGGAGAALRRRAALAA